MKTVILAPHPDDEWIGCGCTILENLDKGNNIKVLIITRKPATEKRIAVSKKLAEKYDYELKILGEAEKNIDKQKLNAFLKENIEPGDVVYVTASDNHPDHKTVSDAVKKLKNKKIEYAVYNASLNPFRKIKHKLSGMLKDKATASFKFGKHSKILDYKLEEKNKNILKFREVPRGGDVLRKCPR